MSISVVAHCLSLDAERVRQQRSRIIQTLNVPQRVRFLGLYSLRPSGGQGESRRARVGRVRKEAVLSILQGVRLLPPGVQISETPVSPQ